MYYRWKITKTKELHETLIKTPLNISNTTIEGTNLIIILLFYLFLPKAFMFVDQPKIITSRFCLASILIRKECEKQRELEWNCSKYWHELTWNRKPDISKLIHTFNTSSSKFASFCSAFMTSFAEKKNSTSSLCWLIRRWLETSSRNLTH